MGIRYDDRVTPTWYGFDIATDNGLLKVMPLSKEPGWAAFFGTSTGEDPQPAGGIPGSLSATAADAIEWALR